MDNLGMKFAIIDKLALEYERRLKTNNGLETNELRKIRKRLDDLWRVYCEEMDKRILESN